MGSWHPVVEVLPDIQLLQEGRSCRVVVAAHQDIRVRLVQAVGPGPVVPLLLVDSRRMPELQDGEGAAGPAGHTMGTAHRTGDRPMVVVHHYIAARRVPPV